MERIATSSNEARPETEGRPTDRAFLQAVVDQSSDLIVVIESDATLRYVSGAANRILGLSPADWLGRSVLELVHPDDVEATVESLGGTGGGLIGHGAGTPRKSRKTPGLTRIGAGATLRPKTV